MMPITNNPAYDAHILELLKESYKALDDPSTIYLTEEEFWTQVEMEERSLRVAA